VVVGLQCLGLCALAARHAHAAAVPACRSEAVGEPHDARPAGRRLHLLLAERLPVDAERDRGDARPRAVVRDERPEGERHPQHRPGGAVLDGVDGEVGGVLWGPGGHHQEARPRVGVDDPADGHGRFLEVAEDVDFAARPGPGAVAGQAHRAGAGPDCAGQVRAEVRGPDVEYGLAEGVDVGGRLLEQDRRAGLPEARQHDGGLVAGGRGKVLHHRQGGVAGSVEQDAAGAGGRHGRRIVQHDDDLPAGAEAQQAGQAGRPEERLGQRHDEEREQRQPQRQQEQVLDAGPAGRPDELLVEELRGRKDDLLGPPRPPKMQDQRDGQRRQTQQKPRGQKRHGCTPSRIGAARQRAATGAGPVSTPAAPRAGFGGASGTCPGRRRTVRWYRPGRSRFRGQGIRGGWRRGRRSVAGGNGCGWPRRRR